MMFLGAVVFFFCTIGLAVYAFVTLENTLLGLATLGLIGIALMVLIGDLKEKA